jgi:hypothetical protein
LERHSCNNAKIAELLAIAGDSARPPLTKAFRRASRRAFLWPEEAADLVQKGRSLTELPGIEPYLEKTIRRWIDDPPATPKLPEIRKGFLTLMQARTIIAEKPAWLKELKGDLQMHTEWSDGSSPIREMALEANQCGYEYIAITDHAKGLKIAGGIDEKQLQLQAREIVAINDEMVKSGRRVRVLHSIELNLNPRGEGDMDTRALTRLDIVLGCFHSSLHKKKRSNGSLHCRPIKPIDPDTRSSTGQNLQFSPWTKRRLGTCVRHRIGTRQGC